MTASKIVDINWNKGNAPYFINKGYMFTEIGDTFKVKIDDLSQNSKVIITAKCDRCNREEKIPYSKYFYNTKGKTQYLCKDCKKEKTKQKRADQLAKKHISKVQAYEEKIRMAAGNGYTLLSKYIDCYTKMAFRCNKCGSIFQTIPNGFLSGTRCPICAGNMKKTTEQFKQEVYDLVKGEYSVLSEYIGTGEKILMRHNKCEYEYMVTPNKFLLGSRCPICYKDNRKQYISDVNKTLKEKYKGEFTILTPYRNLKDKILIKCSICHNQYYISPSALLYREHKCLKCKELEKTQKLIKIPKCKSPIHWNDEIIKTKISELTKGEYEYVGHYKKSSLPVSIKHNKCGTTWNIRIHDFINKGCRCPQCYIEDKCKELGMSIEDWGKEKDNSRGLQKWSGKVKKRDGYKCVICGNETNLNAHHLNGYSWDIKNRTNINNGVTLCEDCHCKFHDIYGYGSNTKEQYEDFVRHIKLKVS